MNPAAIFKLKSAKKTFDTNHPRFQQFLNAANQKAIKEGTIIEINVTTAEGEKMCTNLKLTQSDLELFATLKDIAQS